MAKPPAFQFYVKDWRSSPAIRQATLKERAILIELMALSWEFDPQGKIPLSDREICRELNVEMTTLRRVYDVFRASVRRDQDMLVMQKLVDQGDKYREISEKRKNAAHERHANASQVDHSAFAFAFASKNKVLKPQTKNPPRQEKVKIPVLNGASVNE